MVPGPSRIYGADPVWTSCYRLLVMDRLLLQTFADLFHGIPQVIFCVKDHAGRYLMVNQAFADCVARPSPKDVLGLVARDVFPGALAASYEGQDSAVLASGRPLHNHLELVLRPGGQPGWYMTNKVLHGRPLSSEAWIVSMSLDLEASLPGGLTAQSLDPVVSLVQRCYAEPLSVDDLANAAGLSRSQLARRMRAVFGVSAMQYVQRVRLKEALTLLLQTDVSVGRIATRCGYYDQSSFTRHFKRWFGTTPGQLRADYLNRP